MNLIITLTYVFRLVRESIGLTKDIQPLFVKISNYIDKRKKH